jgi:flagellar biosynthetic protein FliO
MAPGITGADVFRMLGSLGLVIALLVALLWALRKLQGKMNSQNAGRRLQIIESLSVGPRQKVALIRVGEREVLIGISPNQINGIASFYSKSLDGTKTATGEIYRNSKMTGASNNLKLNTWVRVTNLSNGNTVIVRINDRMHPRMAKKGRVIDLSRAAAAELDFMKKGLTKVQLEVVSAQIVD